MINYFLIGFITGLLVKYIIDFLKNKYIINQLGCSLDNQLKDKYEDL